MKIFKNNFKLKKCKKRFFNLKRTGKKNFPKIQKIINLIKFNKLLRKF